MNLPELPDTPDSIPGGDAPYECTTTTVDMQEKQARLPNEASRQYLHLKVEYSMRFPRLTAGVSSKGKSYNISLKQLMMSGLIRIDEIARNYFWYYKAEVPFDMRTTPPRPYLSSTLLKTEGAKRRHTTNPFPESGKGIYRRPDIIIVKNQQDRWPGLAGPDSENAMHADNLERLVEVKFPEDKFGDEQYEDYMLIVGRDRNRLTILEIHDCRPDEGKQADHVFNVAGKAVSKYWPMFFFPPIFLPRPPTTPAAARIEPWTYAVKEAVASLAENAADGWNALSADLQGKLKYTAQWLNDSGKWIHVQAQGVWHWVSDNGKIIKSWTDHELRTAWSGIQRVTDLTLDTLKKIDWIQILTDVAKVAGVVLVSIGVGFLVMTLGIPEALVAALLLIVRLAIMAWDALAAVLAAGAATATLSTQ
ncbi:VRR-NUC domain-containing protein [Rahnella laticis]|uniref:VRR-NUC domain-containing protein n=1 Tax=Rahnella laticis TaxID=2787622 RepID=UPI0018A2D02F|nr:VRR-NUC domain-containing protein [Rahnella laticis]MBF7996595.1 VRR-NUC domain-containing protein [Rahnella laticis]